MLERKQTLTIHCRGVRQAVQSVSLSNPGMSLTIAQNSIFMSYDLPIILPKPWIDSSRYSKKVVAIVERWGMIRWRCNTESWTVSTRTLIIQFSGLARAGGAQTSKSLMPPQRTEPPSISFKIMVAAHQGMSCKDNVFNAIMRCGFAIDWGGPITAQNGTA